MLFAIGSVISLIEMIFSFHIIFRLRPETRLSESTDVSDSPDIPPPPSPESALEAIEGVQPELQKTPKESEVSRKDFDISC